MQLLWKLLRQKNTYADVEGREGEQGQRQKAEGKKGVNSQTYK